MAPSPSQEGLNCVLTPPISHCAITTGIQSMPKSTVDTFSLPLLVYQQWQLSVRNSPCTKIAYLGGGGGGGGGALPMA